MSQVRIIGGTHRSRILKFQDVPGLRPTSDRIRETLFNWLGQTLYGKHCLDLFSGSGALGFESASRGAEQVVMVERNRKAFQMLQRNLVALQFTNVALHCKDGLEFASFCDAQFDIVFVDPPFDGNLLDKVLTNIGRVLKPDGCVYVESGAPIVLDAAWQVLKQAKAGAVHYQLLRRAE